MRAETTVQAEGPGPATRRPRSAAPQTALDRRKAALKANMARRKEQARARSAGAEPDGVQPDDNNKDE